MTRRPRPTGEALDRFLSTIRLGAPTKDAVARSGWAISTVYAWRAEAEGLALRPGKTTERERQLLAFLEAWEKADADFVAGNLAVITRAGNGGTWQASAWLLERRRPDDFSRRLELTGPEGGPVSFEERLGAVLDAARSAKVKTNGHGKVEALADE